VRVLFDTNVVLDLLLDRAPFADDAQQLIARVENGAISGLLCATTITTIHYLLTRQTGEKTARTTIEKLLELFEIAPVGRVVLAEALKSGGKDYEDSVIQKATVHSGADTIVTRDVKGFSRSDIPVYGPRELLVLI